MKLKDLIEHLNTVISEHPEYLELDLVYAIDDEGNDFHRLGFLPSIGNYKNHEFVSEDSFEEYEDDTLTVNAMCIN